MGGQNSKDLEDPSTVQENVQDENTRMSISQSTPNFQKKTFKKKRESHVVGNSVDSRALDVKLGLPEDQNLAMPPEEEFLPSFIELLDELALPKSKRDAMMAMSSDRKWTLLLQQRGREYLMKQVQVNSGHVHENSRKPEEFVSLIKDHSTRKASDLIALEVSLRSEKISWVSEFLLSGGLSCILDILEEFEEKDSLNPNELEILSKTILCMKALMNNSISLKSVLEEERSIQHLVLSLKNATSKMKTQILELLAAVCFVPPDGIQLVLSGFVMFKDLSKEIFRFQTLMNDLRAISNIEFQISCMSLFNAIVNSTDDLEFRVHLRNELLDLRIEEIIEELRLIDNEDLNTQLNVFENEALRDEESIGTRYGVMNINMTDPDEIYRAIRAHVADTTSYSWFLRTMQQLLLIPPGRKVRVQYWRLIYTITAQIVLQRDGIDLDIADFDIDVSSIVNGLIRQEEYEKTQIILSDLEKQVVQQDREIKLLQEEIKKRDQNPQINSHTFVSQQDTQKNPQELDGGYGKSNDSSPPTEVSINTSNQEEESVSSSLPPPPPPPPPPLPGSQSMGAMSAAFSLGLPPKPKVTPSVKMKALHWVKLPEIQIPNSFWFDPIDDNLIRSNIDLKELEERFQSKETVTRKVIDPNDDKKKKEKTEICIIESKRSYNIAIMLSRLRLTFPEVRQAILGMEEGLLNEQMIKNFIEYLPTPEEVESLSIYMSGEASKNLGVAEQFFIEMMKIDRYEQRVKSIYFKRRFQERIDELLPSIESLILSCHELKSGIRLRKIMEVILALGNYMNAGSIKGSAYGFKIGLLTKLSDTKAGDNKFTLIHFLHKSIQSKFPGYENLKDELSHLEKSSKTNTSNILSELNDLRNGVNMISQELNNHKVPKKGDEFYSVMKIFVERASKSFETVEQKYSAMIQIFEDTVKFFGENPKDCPPDVFFGIFSQFITQFEKAGEDNKLEEERKRLADKRAEQESSKKKKARPRGGAAAAAIDDSSRNVMDDLVAAIRSGAVFDRGEEEKVAVQTTGAMRERKVSNAAAAAAALKRKETRKGNIKRQSMLKSDN